MPPRLAERLSLARQRQFVGRAPELGLFEQALESDEPPFVVLHVHGPGGVGKSTLLKEYRYLAERRGARALLIDGREIEATPEGFLLAMRRALDLAADADPLDALAADERRQALLIDTYELLPALDGWLRDAFLPQIPERMLVVLAGRQPPSLAWRTDLGWQSLLRTVALRNLSPGEGLAYLATRNVPDDQRPAVLSFTHGHPLALSLVADLFAQRPGTRFQPDQTPDMINALLGHLVQRVPGPAHRAALEVCALVRLTSEALLAQVLEFLDVHDLFEWLRGLSFVDSTVRGIYPHDLAREALVADLRWRNPDWYRELHRRVREYYTARLPQLGGADQQRLLSDLIYLHRENPVVRPFYEWQESGTSLPEVARPDELPRMLQTIAQFEGDESARIAARWLERPCTTALAMRDPEQSGGDGAPAGLIIQIALQAADPADIAADPLARAAWEQLQRATPPRPGEVATLFRFWMARDGYQQVSAIQSSIFVAIVRHYLTTPGLAATFFVCADPEFWAPGLAYADLQRVPGGDLAIGHRRYGIYSHDWRATPPAAWLALLAERETASDPQAITSAPTVNTLVVLSEEEFANAVREALQEVVRPDALRNSPLLRSRLIVERAGPGAGPAEKAAALQAAIREAAAVLQASPRDLKAYRALYHTYLQPAATQEQAAELLDLPFSTFRRHLKTGITQVTEILWQQETQPNLGGL